MNVETLLDEALRARTAGIDPDPAARDRIAERLTARAAGAGRGPRRRATLAAAAAIIAVAVGASLVVAGDRHPSDRVAAGRGAAASTAAGAVTGGSLPGYPLPPTTFFVATSGASAGQPDGGHDVVVRASDAKIVATLPDIGGTRVDAPQLSPDGRRAYADWANGTRIGYLDLLTGRATVLAHRTGEVGAPTISADGSTLAYQWTPKTDGNDVSSIVVRHLSTGRETVLPHAPAGPILIPLALSPDGRRLALVPTTGTDRPLWIVSTQASDAFADPSVVAGANCGSGQADEPRWTARGLYAVRHCVRAVPGTSAARVTSSDIVTVDLARTRATVTRSVHPVATFLTMTVLDRPSGPLFVVANEDVSPGATVTQFTGTDKAGWMSKPIKGLDGLAG